MHLSKSDLATPICASVACLLVKDGVVFGALHRLEPDDHAHYDQKDLRVFFTGLDQSRLTNLDQSRFVRF